MASVYKRQRIEPVPDGAIIAEKVVKVPKRAAIDPAAGIVTWKDDDGIERTAAIVDDGSRMTVKTATWNVGGKTRTAAVTLDGLGIVRVGAKWHCKYPNRQGRYVQRSTGTSDLKDATRKAAKWESDEHDRRTGIVDVRAEEANKQGAKSVDDAVVAYVAYLSTKNGTPKHRDRTDKYIREFMASGNWQTIADINADSATRHAQKLLSSGMAARAVNARLTAVKGFTRWLVPDKWHCDPLAGVRKPNPDTDRRTERRALLPEEWGWLRDATAAGEDRQGLSGTDRVTLYMLALQTGLRVNEIASLTRGQLALADAKPYVRCKAAGTKNRKPAKQYIDDELARRLADTVALKSKAAKVFEFTDQNTVADMLRADLAAARVNWIRSASDPAERERRTEDDFLNATNADGESLDFHALRHTCGAWLAVAGVHPKVIQTVLRHATITLTMDRYGHLFPGQDSEAVQSIGAVMRGEIDVTPTLIHANAAAAS